MRMNVSTRNHLRITLMVCLLALTQLTFGATQSEPSRASSAINTPPGWEWYNVPLVPKKKPRTQPRAINSLQASIIQMQALRELVASAMDQAVLDPTPDHAANYLRLNHLLTQNAKNFTISVQQALLIHPELDFMLGHPTQSAARAVQLKAFQEKVTQKLHDLAKTRGFIFFYRGNQPMDVLAAKTLAGFAKAYHIAIIGVSVDGAVDPLFSTNTQDQGQARALGVKAYPALFLVDPKARRTQPVFYGVLSQTEIVRRLYNVATNFEAERNG